MKEQMINNVFNDHAVYIFDTIPFWKRLKIAIGVLFYKRYTIISKIKFQFKKKP